MRYECYMYRTHCTVDVMLFAKPRQRRNPESIRVYISSVIFPTSRYTLTHDTDPEAREFRYYDFIMAAYVCVLLCSNLIGPAKETTVHVPLLGSITFLAGVLFFPISYIFGDILTEVYGYGRDRRVVWAGFGALAFASLMAAVVVHLPPSASSHANQAAVEAIFGNTPRIVLASIMRVSLRHLRQQLCARQDENLDPGALAVDAHRGLHAVRRIGGFGDLLFCGLLWAHADRRIWSSSCLPNTR